MEQTIKETYPDVVQVVPAIFPGSTDAKHYTSLTNNIFRFGPQVVTRENAKLVHNVDERMEVSMFEQSIDFYNRLVRYTCGTSVPQVVLQQEESDLSHGIKGD